MSARFEDFKKRMLEKHPTIEAMFLENKEAIRAQEKKDRAKKVYKKMDYTGKGDVKKNIVYLQK